MTAELLRFQEERPDLFLNSRAGLRSIPDWLIKGPNMKVPCTEHRLIWVGAAGTVQLCYVTFKLGNLHEKRLRDILFTPEHVKAAQDAIQFNCPNCHCSYDVRVLRHVPARHLYQLDGRYELVGIPITWIASRFDHDNRWQYCHLHA